MRFLVEMREVLYLFEIEKYEFFHIYFEKKEKCP